LTAGAFKFTDTETIGANTHYIVPATTQLTLCDKTDWTIASFSDQVAIEPASNIIDNDYSSFWSSDYYSYPPCPHWVVIDMQNPVEIYRLVTHRRDVFYNGTETSADTKAVEYYISDDASGWTKIADVNTWVSHVNMTVLENPVSGRYLKLVGTESNRLELINIVEVDVCTMGTVAANTPFSAENIPVSKVGWQVLDASDEGVPYTRNKIVDGDYNTFWHTDYFSLPSPPHWLVIDMQEDTDISRISIMRRSNPQGNNATEGDTKTVEVYIGSDPNPDADRWTKIGAVEFLNFGGHTLSFDVNFPVSGRYLKIILPDSHRLGLGSISEIDVYKPLGRTFDKITDASVPGWTVSVADPAYKVKVDFSSNKMYGGIFSLPIGNLYVVGGCTCGGWDPANGIPFVPDTQNPYEFVFDGILGVYEENDESDLFYILGPPELDFYNLRPYAANEPIISSKYVLENKGDNKWSIAANQQGRYIFKVNTFFETITGEFVEAGPSSIEEIKEQGNDKQLRGNIYVEKHTLHISGFPETISVDIYNVSGQKIATYPAITGDKQINILADGVYVVTVLDNGEQISKKIIVQ
jgi:hypothetical protein